MSLNEVATTMGKTAAEALIEEGFEQGFRQGFQRGRRRAKRESVLRLMRAKFGDVPVRTARRVRAIRKPERLDALLDRPLLAERVDDVLE